jgi:hypothetical protein
MAPFAFFHLHQLALEGIKIARTVPVPFLHDISRAVAPGLAFVASLEVASVFRWRTEPTWLDPLLSLNL